MSVPPTILALTDSGHGAFKRSPSVSITPTMRRLVDYWWLVGSALLVAVIALTCALYAEQSNRGEQQQHATQHQAVSALRESVDDVLAREAALARVAGTLPGSVGARWPVLSNIVMDEPLANSTAFIQPVTQRDRAAFERRTGLRLVESTTSGVIRVAGPRPLHLVLTAIRQGAPGAPLLGLDLAPNALRRNLLLAAARTGRQLATPPIEFLGRTQPTRGVAVFTAVRDQRGRLKGWVSAAYEASQLASMVTAHMPGVHLTIRDGASALVSEPGPLTGRPAVIAVAGRSWRVWAEVAKPGISATPWLVLTLGVTLTFAVMLILRQGATGARQSFQQLALRDAEQTAVSQIATLVAQGEAPDVVFRSVAKQIATLLNSYTGAVSRFDPATNQGIILGGWTRDGQDLADTVYDLDGVTASAAVFRTGRPARTDTGPETDYASSTDPIAGILSTFGAKRGVAAPITVAGHLWGALGAAYGDDLIPAGVEARLERFASLVGLAISNADAWDRLARQASTDPLTGIANHRAFHEQLSAEIARAHRYGRHLSLVLLDLDHFKAVNDRHGHPAGDRVLVLFAQLLAAHRREGELVARIGGEEFAWLMPETDQPGAVTAAERVRTAMDSTPFEDVGTVTVSAGVCSSDQAGDADALVRTADRALYWAKDSGRNMTFVYTEEVRGTIGSQATREHLTTPPSTGTGAADRAQRVRH
jgi:diguanylate cyclase (GGDEF)-like protein